MLYFYNGSDAIPRRDGIVREIKKNPPPFARDGGEPVLRVGVFQKSLERDVVYAAVYGEGGEIITGAAAIVECAIATTGY